MNKKLLIVALVLVTSQQNETAEMKRRKSPYRNLRIEVPVHQEMGTPTHPRDHNQHAQTNIMKCVATVEAGISLFLLCSYTCARALCSKIINDDDAHF